MTTNSSATITEKALEDVAESKSTVLFISGKQALMLSPCNETHFSRFDISSKSWTINRSGNNNNV